jgi:penicillin-binding protein 2
VFCAGGQNFFGRVFKCHKKGGHGSVDMRQAIKESCDVYFYTVGSMVGVDRIHKWATALGLGVKSGIDLPNDNRPSFPTEPIADYFNRKYGARGWSGNSPSLNLAIGQGENSQTVVNLARFYTALANGGDAMTPHVVHAEPERTRLFELDSATLDGVRAALAGVVSRGTAAASQIQGVVLAGKTGTAQSGRFVNGTELDHAWFAGFAPAVAPKIVVAVMIEYGGHGTRAARIASKIIEHYLKAAPTQFLKTEGE